MNRDRDFVDAGSDDNEVVQRFGFRRGDIVFAPWQPGIYKPANVVGVNGSLLSVQYLNDKYVENISDTAVRSM